LEWDGVRWSATGRRWFKEEKEAPPMSLFEIVVGAEEAIGGG